jgi:hypothetical protein
MMSVKTKRFVIWAVVKKHVDFFPAEQMHIVEQTDTMLYVIASQDLLETHCLHVSNVSMHDFIF